VFPFIYNYFQDQSEAKMQALNWPNLRWWRFCVYNCGFIAYSWKLIV